MKRRVFLLLLSVAILMPIVVMTVSANSPPPNTAGPQPYNGIQLLRYILLSLGGLILTVIVESVAAYILLPHTDYIGLVIVTNICSQIIMHSINLCLNQLLYRYEFLLLVILELFVYVMEFLVYKQKMRSVPVKKVLIYTCVANTLSLAAGIAGCRYLFFIL